MLTAENTTGGDIPDNSEAGIEYPLTVAGVPVGATVTDLSVDLAIEHTWVGDLIIELRGPNGEVLNLVDRPGRPLGTFGDSSNAAATAEGTISFDDNAASGVNAEDMGATIFGDEVICLDDGICNYFPNDQSTFFSDIIGGDPNGEWNLFVSDNGGGDTGFVANWALNVTYTTPASPDGVVVNYDLPTATDDVDGPVAVDYVSGPMSGDYLEPGVYTVEYSATDAAGNSDSCSFTITVNDVLISRAAVADEKMDFRAYPVPFENEVTIQYMFEYDTNVTIEMFDTKGLLVATKTNKNYMSGSTERVKFDLSRTAVQMLYVKLTTNQGSVTKKIVSGK
jgi:subtilisin-like proprotein convertase family protein